MKKLLLLGLSAVVMLASCVKKKESAPQGEAHIRFVNAVIGSPAQDVYINEKKVVSGTLTFGTATQYLSYTSGISAMGFVDPSTGNVNASENYGADIGTYSTLFFYANKAGYMTAGGILDNMTPPPAGKAKVRFINLHYNLENAFIIAVQGGANLLTSLEFGAASTYFEVEPGAKFTTQAVGVTTNPVIDLNIQAGKIYNVWLSGENATEIYGHGYIQN